MFARTVRRSRSGSGNRRSSQRSRKKSYESCTSPKRKLKGELSSSSYSSYRYSQSNEIPLSPARTSSSGSSVWSAYVDSPMNRWSGSSAISAGPVSRNSACQQPVQESNQLLQMKNNTATIVVSIYNYTFLKPLLE
ncbi:hypothetical protein ACF0H5_011352 [Mactra antiquata]